MLIQVSGPVQRYSTAPLWPTRPGSRAARKKKHAKKKHEIFQQNKWRCIFIQSIPTKTSFKGTSKKFEDVLGHIPRRNPLHSVYPGCEAQGIHTYISARLDHWRRNIALSPRPPLRAMQSCPHKVPLPPPLMQPWDQSCEYWFEIYCALNFLFPPEIVSTESYFVKRSQLNTVYQVGSSHTMSAVCRIYWKSSTQKDGGFLEKRDPGSGSFPCQTQRGEFLRHILTHDCESLTELLLIVDLKRNQT